MIKEIEIKGKKEKFSFGLGFLGDMFEKESISFIEFDSIEKINPFKTTLIKLHRSYNYANDLDVSKKDFEEMISDEYMIISTWFNKIYNESMTKNVPTQEKKTKTQVKK